MRKQVFLFLPALWLCGNYSQPLLEVVWLDQVGACQKIACMIGPMNVRVTITMEE